MGALDFFKNAWALYFPFRLENSIRKVAKKPQASLAGSMTVPGIAAPSK